VADIQIRSLDASDFERVIPLFREMEEHYEGAFAVSSETIRTRVQTALFDPKKYCCEALVAEDKSELAGVAIFTIVFPAAHLTTALLLKDLYVCRRYRCRGVASLLFAHLARLALQLGCSRIDWTTNSENHIARGLYDKLGAALIDKANYRLEGDELLRMATLRTHETKET
jgi:GNAT superfamily N-acetyltransferase